MVQPTAKWRENMHNQSSWFLNGSIVTTTIITLLLGGCGKDCDDTGSSDTNSTTDTNTATDTDTGTDTSTNTDTGSGNDDSNRTSLATIEALGEPEDSSCRNYGLPDDIDLQGCTVAGPYMGEIVGDALSDEGSFEGAIDTCLQDEQCSGMSTSWYMDAPWVAYSATEEFAIDESSYGCTFVVYCP
jgi:hypothetical protein